MAQTSTKQLKSKLTVEWIEYAPYGWPLECDRQKINKINRLLFVCFFLWFTYFRVQLDLSQEIWITHLIQITRIAQSQLKSLDFILLKKKKTKDVYKCIVLFQRTNSLFACDFYVKKNKQTHPLNPRPFQCTNVK